MRTSTFTVDNVGNPEPVTAEGRCTLVDICEDADAGTTDFIVHAPNADSPGVRLVAGRSHQFIAGNLATRAFFDDKDVVGYVETVNGTVSFRKVCQ